MKGATAKIVRTLSCTPLCTPTLKSSTPAKLTRTHALAWSLWRPRGGKVAVQERVNIGRAKTCKIHALGTTYSIVSQSSYPAEVRKWKFSPFFSAKKVLWNLAWNFGENFRATFSRVWCARENFAKISRQKRREKRKISRKFPSAGAQRWQYHPRGGPTKHNTQSTLRGIYISERQRHINFFT